jgi:small-conductance mechanosensitive channel
MSDLLTAPTLWWPLVLIVGLPLALALLGEAVRRLRERQSRLVDAAVHLQRWTVPLVALWILIVPILGGEENRPVPRLLATGAGVSAAIAAAFAIRAVAGGPAGRTGWARGVPRLSFVMLRVAVVAVAAWFVLDRVWGADLSNSLAALGVGSAIVALALQDSLSALFAGVLLVSERPFRPGDWIRTGDVEGRIVEVGWRSTTIELRSRDWIVVPNGLLAGQQITNYTRPTPLHRETFELQIAYVNPPNKAKAMLLAAARNTPGVLAHPEPTVRVTTLDDPLMGYELRFFVDGYTAAPRIRSDVMSQVWYQAERDGVPLPSPAFDLYHYDGNETAREKIPTRATLRGRIRSAPLLAPLAPAEIARLATTASSALYAAGEDILPAGHTEPDLYILVAGRAAAVGAFPDGDSVEVMQLASGDLFGLATEREGANISVIASTDCEVVQIDGLVASEVVARHPDVAASINQLISARQRQFERLRGAHRTDTEAGEDAPAPAAQPEPLATAAPVDRGNGAFS